MTEMLSIPLAPGIRQDGDRTLLPPGTLVAATGTRARKGGIAKANGLIDAGVTAADGTFEGPCDALGFAAGRQVAVMNGRAWSRHAIGDSWVEVGRASRARPVKAHWLAFTDATDGITQAACAVIGEFKAVAHYDGEHVHLFIVDRSGNRRQAATFEDRDRPRLFAVGSTFMLLMRDPATPEVVGVSINGSTLAISSETSGFATLQSANDVFDAAPFSATQWLLAWRSAAAEFTVRLYNAPFSLVGGQAVACSGVVQACNVYGSADGIWATFDDTNAQKVAAYAADITSVTGGPSGFHTSHGSWPAAITRRASGSVWVVWTASTVGPPQRYTTKFARVDTSAAVVDAGWIHHLRLASRPWDGSEEGFRVWLHSDSTGGEEWSERRRYMLTTVVRDSGTPTAFGAFLEPELTPDERAFFNVGFHLPEIALFETTDESGATVERGIYPGLAVIRTQREIGPPGTAALVLYEWETDAELEARGRQVAEVGGNGVVFGGGLQEIPNSHLHPAGLDTVARGVENGFMFPPAILSATATAGAGLTTDTLYQFRVVFEHVTPDGLRTRSEPSNIATATPTGANLRVTLEISTCPTSEREFLSPPNATVAHVYATTGGGNTFQRVSPDAGLALARGNTSTTILTYVHSTADADVVNNEPLYTERGGIANQPAPAHRFGWVGGGYAWVGGLFNPQLIERSKLVVPNEPVQFTRQNSHRCLLPEECTGGAWLDGVSVVFSRTGIYLVPPTLGAPQRLPSTVGCLDFRSIVEIPEGIVFQSRRGIELLPRGFGLPELISAPIQDELRGRRVIAATVTGHDGSAFADAARVGERHLVLFAIDPALAGDTGRRLVFDLDAKRWLSSDPPMTVSGAKGELLTSWDGRLVIGSRGSAAEGIVAALRYQSATDWGAMQAVPVSVTLADLRPAGIVARANVHRVQLLGELRSTTEVTLSAYIDGKYSKPLLFDAPTQIAEGTTGDKFLLEWALPRRQMNALTLKLDCADPSGQTGEGVVLHAVGLELDGLPGRPRVPQERTAS